MYVNSSYKKCIDICTLHCADVHAYVVFNSKTDQLTSTITMITVQLIIAQNTLKESHRATYDVTEFTEYPD